MNEAVLELRAVERRYRTAGGALAILRGVDLQLQPGEMVGLVAPSGAGKSTLLHIAGLLERPDGGEVIVAGHVCSTLNDAKRTALRRRCIGFVYQFHQLLPEFSAQENVMLAQMIAGARRPAAMKRAAELLETVGLGARMRHRPATLSGGEQQRVAIARAMANEPAMLLADEPTGNLDPATAGHVFAELTRLVQKNRLTALVATHNLDLARRMDRVVSLHDGALAPWSSLTEPEIGATRSK